ncbi:LPXTG cell wall anchor domain-containing protein [Arthrobacter sp. Z4-13]
MKKTLAALALAGSIALLGAAPAMADLRYVSDESPATVSDGTPAPGETFIFSGTGMLPNEPVTITVTPVDAAAPAAGSQSVAAKISIFQAPQSFSTTADARGAFSLPISISEAGTYSILATGNISGNQAGPVTVKVEVALANTGGAALANSGSSTGLANTGADSGLVLWTLVGAGALAAGATSVVVVRRRAKVEVAA